MDSVNTSSANKAVTYPKLKGSRKQLGWAYKVRARFAEAFPESALLRSQTDAKFWIENRRVFDFAVEGFRQAGKGCADSKEE